MREMEPHVPLPRALRGEDGLDSVRSRGAMGTWGPGLYDNDTASDMRPAIAAVARLPFSAQEVVDLFVARHRDVAENPADDDHVAFWLVLADQLHRRGLDAAEVFERARDLAKSGADDRVMASVGMSAADRKKREQHLRELVDRLAQPVTPKKRKTLSAPQRLVMVQGQVGVAEVNRLGELRNPYMREGRVRFEPAGYTLFAVVATEHVFGFLAAYAVVVLRGAAPLEARPDLATALSLGPWGFELPATCSSAHARKMRLETIGTVPIASDLVTARAAPLLKEMEEFAVQDVSIANRLRVTPPRKKDIPISSLRELIR